MEIEKLIADCNSLYQEDQGALPRIHFDRHLYQPLLVERRAAVTSSPLGLRGERAQIRRRPEKLLRQRAGRPPG